MRVRLRRKQVRPGVRRVCGLQAQIHTCPQPATARCTWPRRSLACATCRRPVRRWSNHAHHLPGRRHDQARLGQRSFTSLHVPTRAAGRRVPATNKPRPSSAETARPRHGNTATSRQRAERAHHNPASPTIMEWTKAADRSNPPWHPRSQSRLRHGRRDGSVQQGFICLGWHPGFCLCLCSADKRYPLGIQVLS
jgi:hypothetical protein